MYRHRLRPSSAYDLAGTLDSGQVFGWTREHNSWQGVVAGRWVRLTQVSPEIEATTTLPQTDWSWLADYLLTSCDLERVLTSFPADSVLRQATQTCRGLHLLRQDPWECLLGFLLSSTKQITQIRQVYRHLCEQLGEPIPVPAGEPIAFAPPSAATVAKAGEAALRDCRMGFRAGYLHQVARRIADGRFHPMLLRKLPIEEARRQLQELPGVGRKIADCVLLFSADHPAAFPIDVWIAKCLRRFYFEDRRIPLPTLQTFATQHFGPYAGYAQQYLFHYARQHAGLDD